MNKQKFTALALGALGLTGFLFALAAGLTANLADPETVDRGMLTTFCLIGHFGGALLMALGGIRWDRIRQRELDDAEMKRKRFRARA